MSMHTNEPTPTMTRRRIAKTVGLKDLFAELMRKHRFDKQGVTREIADNLREDDRLALAAADRLYDLFYNEARQDAETQARPATTVRASPSISAKPEKTLQVSVFTHRLANGVEIGAVRIGECATLIAKFDADRALLSEILAYAPNAPETSPVRDLVPEKWLKAAIARNKPSGRSEKA